MSLPLAAANTFAEWPVTGRPQLLFLSIRASWNVEMAKHLDVTSADVSVDVVGDQSGSGQETLDEFGSCH